MLKQLIKKTIEESIKELLTGEVSEKTKNKKSFDNGMIGKYVIVRCRNAGVHSGVLVSHNGQECLLKESRRLWYWKTTGDGDFLSSIALNGVHEDSKIGAEIEIHLTESCEIIKCTEKAEKSIRNQRVYNG